MEPRHGRTYPYSAARLLGWLLALLLGLCGCKSDSPDTVRLAGWLASPVEAALTRSLLDTFKAEHPDLPVRYEPIPANYMDKLLLMLGTGTGPDLIMVESFWIPELAARGLLLSLDDLAGADSGAGLEDFEPALLEAFRNRGRLYALPKDYSTLVLYFNPELLAAAGLDRPPADWSGFAAAARRLTRDTNGDGRPDVHGYAHAEALEYTLPFVWQNGGEYLDDTGRPRFTEPAFVEALEFLQGLKTQGWAVLPTDVGAAWNMEAFGRRRVAMAISGLWALNFLKNSFPETPFRVAPLPAGRISATVNFVVGYAIPRSARHPQQAWTLLRYLTGPDGSRLWAKAGVGLPPRRSATRDMKLGLDPVRKVFLESLAYARPWRFPVDQRVLDRTETALQAIFITGAPVRSTLDRLQRHLIASRPSAIAEGR